MKNIPNLITMSRIVGTIFIACIIATISAIEELIINIVSKNLNRDINSLVYYLKQ